MTFSIEEIRSRFDARFIQFSNFGYAVELHGFIKDM